MNKKQKQREKLWSLLGDLPDRDRPISILERTSEVRSGYRLDRLVLDLNGSEPVPTYLALPLNVTKPIPAILYHHSHGGRYDIGKEELVASNSALQNPPYAEDLTSHGWAALCIDCWNFGDRQRGSESALFKAMLWQGEVLWGEMVYDAVRALEFLCSLPEIDASRIGTLGMSMGSTLAWWLSALDERIKVCVDLCCLTDFKVLLEEEGLDRHGLYYYVPGLMKHFQTADINALIAPRPHLSQAGRLDNLTPAAGLDRIDQELRKVYQQEGAADAWKLRRYDCGHEETPAMRSEVLRWFEKWL